ncbi:hypothetical protein KY362_04410, partial [Candidatus Woesearchaeota archaeon]|nr:hypothetical protein [Candidatus Woesearchaeota archaeon]
IDLRAGKWGPYGVCMRCGNISWAKILSCNTIKPGNTKPSTASSEVRPRQKQFKRTYKPESEKRDKQGRKEIVMTSDEVDFYFG